MTRIRRRVVGIVLVTCASAAFAQSAPAAAAGSATAKPPSVATKLRLRIGSKELMATLADNPTARDFASLLPLKLRMNDLFRREKTGRLPRALVEGGQRVFAYSVGEIVLWSPDPSVAVYYKNDGERIPSPGIIVLGKVDAGAQALDVPGSVEVTIEKLD